MCIKTDRQQRYLLTICYIQDHGKTYRQNVYKSGDKKRQKVMKIKKVTILKKERKFIRYGKHNFYFKIIDFCFRNLKFI